MKHIIGAYCTLAILILNLFLCAGVLTVSAEAAAAEAYKAAVTAEIENSNFNPKVIAECEKQAEIRGYELRMENGTYDEIKDARTAEIMLSYTYKLPVLGIQNKKTIRGIAR